MLEEGVYADDSTVDLGEGTPLVDPQPGSIPRRERFWIFGDNNEIIGTETSSMGTLMGDGNTFTGGDTGNVIFVANEASENVVVGGDAKDTLLVTGGKNNKVFAGEGDDLLTAGYSAPFSPGLDGELSGNTLYGEAGNDDIRVMPFQDTTVHGGDDLDTLSVFMDYSNDMSFNVSAETRDSEDGLVMYELRAADGKVAVRFSGIEKVEFTNGIIAYPGDNGIWELVESS